MAFVTDVTSIRYASGGNVYYHGLYIQRVFEGQSCRIKNPQPTNIPGASKELNIHETTLTTVCLCSPA